MSWSRRRVEEPMCKVITVRFTVRQYNKLNELKDLLQKEFGMNVTTSDVIRMILSDYFKENNAEF